MQAVFLRHEGYLGALGALMSYRDPNGENLILEESKEKVSVNKDALFISKKNKDILRIFVIVNLLD
jgi:type II pantothenate kinase